MAAGRQTAPAQGGSTRCRFLQEREKYGWFAAASLAGVLAEGACRVLYFMGNQAVISHQDMAFASWASSAGTFLDGVFLALSKWLLAGLAVLLFYGRMRLSTYLEGNVLYFVILLMVLPAFQWMLNPMFVQNVVFSVGLSLVGGIEIVSAACLLYWIASFIQKKRRRETKL